MFYDFPETVGNGKSSLTNSLTQHDFSEGFCINHQPGMDGFIFFQYFQKETTAKKPTN